MQFETINQLIQDGPLTLDINGDCMLGSLPHGSQVQIKRRTFYWPGDIVVYGHADDRLVIHRFLGYIPGRQGWRGVTQADNVTRADAPVALGRILGKVSHIDQEPAACSLWQRLQAFVYYLLALLRFSGQLMARFISIFTK